MYLFWFVKHIACAIEHHYHAGMTRLQQNALPGRQYFTQQGLLFFLRNELCPIYTKKKHIMRIPMKCVLTKLQLLNLEIFPI